MSRYSRWFAAFGAAIDDVTSLRSLQCPECGRSELRLLFLVDREGAHRGTAVFWCARCARGLLPLAVLVPDGADTVLRGTEGIPNYSIVADQ